ncbi:MAG: hypothetical protein ACYTGL_13995 [Planctomycetota bacterium]|jgi:hypothetical protein
MDVMSNVETDDDLIGQAKSATQKTNWIVGRCAAEWKARDESRTDEQFAELIGRGRSTVAQCRRVWECFGEEAESYGRNNDVAWSFWRDLLNDDNHAALFRWMMSNEATPTEVWAYARVLRGEDLTQPATAEPVDGADGSSASIDSVDPPLSAERDPRENEVAPFRATGGAPPDGETRLAPERNEGRKQQATNLKRKLSRITTIVSELVDSGLGDLAKDHLDQLAEDIRQGETPSGLDGNTISALIREAQA